MLGPVCFKAAVQSLLEEALGPRIADWRRGICGVLGEKGPKVSLLVSHLIAPDARVAVTGSTKR